MMVFRFIFLSFLLFWTTRGDSQSDSIVRKINTAVHKNLTQQKSGYEKIREGFYNEKGFERYKGKIEILKDSAIRYDSIILQLYNIPSEYRVIFEKGIFYPGVFTGDQSGNIMHPGSRPDSATALGNCFTHYNIIGVSALNEIKSERNSYTIKRFRIWEYSCGFANPREFIFELDNKLANENTSLADFINGSKLTLIRFITIII